MNEFKENSYENAFQEKDVKIVELQKDIQKYQEYVDLLKKQIEIINEKNKENSLVHLDTSVAKNELKIYEDKILLLREKIKKTQGSNETHDSISIKEDISVENMPEEIQELEKIVNKGKMPIVLCAIFLLEKVPSEIQNEYNNFRKKYPKIFENTLNAVLKSGIKSLGIESNKRIREFCVKNINNLVNFTET